ncbi:hypothetical protein [Streptococcus respiraculi]|uniref:hypothetical protein n=1 Tax=Streptococcus respiraculi TaxID=2021971 RepID=UPI000E73A6F2|nr:hypothetical protein [Streptococcus respiraculi]
MKYQDKKTGAVVLCDSILSGDWVLVDESEKVASHSSSDLTVSEMKAVLEQLGIAYHPKAKKSEILALYEEHAV